MFDKKRFLDDRFSVLVFVSFCFFINASNKQGWPTCRLRMYVLRNASYTFCEQSSCMFLSFFVSQTFQEKTSWFSLCSLKGSSYFWMLGFSSWPFGFDTKAVSNMTIFPENMDVNWWYMMILGSCGESIDLSNVSLKFSKWYLLCPSIQGNRLRLQYLKIQYHLKDLKNCVCGTGMDWVTVYCSWCCWWCCCCSCCCWW